MPFSTNQGGAIAALFAHTYPQQVEGLILFGSFGCLVKKEYTPYGIDFDIQCKSFEEIAEYWDCSKRRPFITVR